ncbi:MAG: hypothetical protein HY036_03830 [Nitrospirae bacterium]|nr:hypothetical protein [Nitrospirota bacterium]
MNKPKEERDDNAVERSSCQYRWRNNSKERYEPRTTMTSAIPTQPCHEDKDIDRDLDQTGHNIQPYEEVREVGDKEEGEPSRR